MIEVTYQQHVGSDITVVNAARVSFGKKSRYYYGDEAEIAADFSVTYVNYKEWEYPTFMLSEDVKLINYLAKHNHKSPFNHCFITFHVKAPIFVARQLVKHQVGLVWNEVSRRYVDSEVEFYEPWDWRLAAEDKKQGSSEETIDYDISSVHESCKEIYEDMLKSGIAPEMARMVLPQSMYTEWYWSGTLMAFARVCNLRCKPDTQVETQMVADQIDVLAKELFPNSWEALRDV